MPLPFLQLHKRLIDKGSELEGEEEPLQKKRMKLSMEYLVQLEEEAGSFGSAYTLTIVLLGKVCPLYVIEGLPMKVSQSGHWGVAFH